VTTDAPTPLPLQPWPAERERIARILRERSLEKRMSPDPFSDRVERVYGARSQGELEELVSDVQPARASRRLLLRLVEWLSRLGADLEAAWNRASGPPVRAESVEKQDCQAARLLVVLSDSPVRSEVASQSCCNFAAASVPLTSV
jgi:hypothetical protein